MPRFGSVKHRQAVRAAWMQRFKEKCAELDVLENDRHDFWDTATHFFLTGYEPGVAAYEYCTHNVQVDKEVLVWKPA